MRPDLMRDDVDTVLVAPFDAVFDVRPDGLVGAHRLVGEDGDIVTYSQWSGPSSREGFTAYRRYRSQSRPDREPGCVVLVSVEFDRPGVAEEWVDLVLEALAAEEDPHPGGISAHFHVSTDGMRVLNYAEWVSAEAHVEALERSGGSVGRNARWRRVQEFPAMTGSTVKRYRVVEHDLRTDR
jgi:hypothetical protein